MRSEKEMFDLLLGIAQQDERILAVVMNGSRANPDIPKDQYQDYDIVYVVQELSSFLQDPNWIDVFGKRAIMQCPEQLDLSTKKIQAIEEEYTYLMLFEDHTRIDLKLMCYSHAVKQYEHAVMGIVLYDTTNHFQDLYEPSAYHIKQPTQEQFYATCNEFWWCLQNVGKGMARHELAYALGFLNRYVRDALHEVLETYIGIPYQFQISAGKLGRNYQRYLPENLWHQYKLTYSDATKEQIWMAIEQMSDLFHTMATAVATSLNYPYSQAEEDGIRTYLQSMKADCFR